MALEVLEKYEDAIASFDKTIELNPNSSKAWNSKGYLLVQLERDDEALACFDKALELNSTMPLLTTTRLCLTLSRDN